MRRSVKIQCLECEFSAKKNSYVDIVPHVSCYVNLRFRICVSGDVLVSSWR